MQPGRTFPQVPSLTQRTRLSYKSAKSSDLSLVVKPGKHLLLVIDNSMSKSSKGVGKDLL
jgi:hypothetical protein